LVGKGAVSVGKAAALRAREELGADHSGLAGDIGIDCPVLRNLSDDNCRCVDRLGLVDCGITRRSSVLGSVVGCVGGSVSGDVAGSDSNVGVNDGGLIDVDSHV